MKQRNLTLFILTFLVIVGFFFMWSKRESEPKRLVARYDINWLRKDEFLEFSKAFKLPLIWPNGLVINGKYLYAPDFSEGIQILRIKPDGSLTPEFYFGKRYKELKVLYTTQQGLAVKRNYLYVADSGNHRIQVFKINPDGNLSPKFSFGKKGDGSGEFSAPVGLAIKGNCLYVADTGNHRIQTLKINPDGNLSPKFSFGKKGDGLGEFKYEILGLSVGLAIKGNCLYVADTGNHRIQTLKINPDGNLSPKFSFGKKGDGLGEFSVAPVGLAIKGNCLYVADTGNHRIQTLKINPDGNLSPKFSFGKKGDGLGEFSAPVGLAIKGNFIYVGDTGNSRIQVLEIKY